MCPSPPDRRRSRTSVGRPTALDLFSGAGGFSLGAEQAGFDVLAAVEYDPICAGVHRFNFPMTRIVCRDAAALTVAGLREALAEGWRAHRTGQAWDEHVDLVVGGPPCQGFSVIGKRAFDDPRNQLVFSFARLVGGIKPRYFVMENVPGLASVRAGTGTGAPYLLELLIEEFESFGYQVLDPRVLNAHNYGVPQDRRRLIIIGWLDGETRPSYPRPLTRGRLRAGGEAPANSDEAGLPLCPSVEDAMGDLPNLDAYLELNFSDELSLSPAAYQKQTSQLSEYANSLRQPALDDRGYPREWDKTIITSSQRTRHTSSVAERFSLTRPGSSEAVSRFFRLHPQGVSPTLRAGTHYDRGSFNAARPIHSKYHRVISVREAARLHSYPDWFRFHWTKWHGFREVGNSLPPRVANAVAKQIAEALGAIPSRPEKALPPEEAELLYLENIEAAHRFEADLSRIPRNSLRSRKAGTAAA